MSTLSAAPRRDSFITHRAFCDALTEESAKAIGLNAMAAAPAAHHHHHPLLFSPPAHVMQQQQQDIALLQEHHHHQQQQHQEVMQPPPLPPHCNYAMKTEMPPWPAMTYDHPLLQPPFGNAAAQSSAASTPPPQPQLPAASAHLSATALLQKAAQMGATLGGAGAGSGYTQMAGAAPAGSAAFGLGLPGLQNAQQQQQDGGGGGVMAGLARTASSHGRGAGEEGVGAAGGGGGGGSDGMTRDFLGLRAFSHRDILGLAGLDSSCMGAITAANAGMSCYEPQPQGQQQHQHQSSNEPWHGMGSHG